MINLRKILSLMPNGDAAHLARRFNMAPNQNGKAASVKSFAESLGFSVERVPLGKISGRLVQDAFAPNGYCIQVKQNESVQRQRFTVLHEIGHYFLHSNQSDPFAPAKLRDRKNPFYLVQEQVEEREADEFAAALFFDHGALHAAITSLGDENRKLAHVFGVSEEVVRIGKMQF